jgi:hypothetical protein
MTFEEALSVSVNRDLPMEEVEALVASIEGSSAAALDALAIEIARRYMHNGLSFEVADSLMNTLFGYAATVRKETIPSLMFSVFQAFDAGEYHHREDAPDVDSEQK